MALFYLFFFAGVGVYVPFLALYLQRLGLSAGEIGVVMTVSPIVALLTQPFWGLVSDWLGDRRKTMMVMIAGTAAASLAIPLMRSTWSLALMMGVMAFFTGALVPVGDSLALEQANRQGRSYASYRLWGSGGFALCALIAGWVFTRIDLVWSFVIYPLFLVMTALSVWRSVGPAPRNPAWRSGWAGVAALRSATGLWIFIAIAFLFSITTTAQNAFFTLYLRALNAGEAAVGIAWTISALVEIPIFAVIGPYIRRHGPFWPIVAGFGIFAVRFWLYSVAGSPEQVYGIQIIAGLGFAVFQSAVVVMLGQLSPPGLQATGQTLYAAVSVSLGAIVGNLLGGLVIDLYGVIRFYQIVTVWVVVVTALLALARPWLLRSSQGADGTV